MIDIYIYAFFNATFREAKVRACFDCLSSADVVISRDAFRAPWIDQMNF